jgi:hypothetical protein
MIEKYEAIFDEFKKFIETNSEYNPRVVKYNTNTSTYFPIVCCYLSNFMDTDYCTIDKVENHQEMYLTTEVYTKDKVVNNEQIASQVINDELVKLTFEFFNKLNLKMTLCRITPNLDTSILRRTIQHQGLVSLTRNNIIRR